MSPPHTSTPHNLSKSKYLLGMQCHKALYLDRFHPNLRDPLDAETQARFQTGHEVGELARELFPGGAIASVGSPPRAEPSIQRTQKLIREGAPTIYEAAFQFNGVLAYVDILARNGDRWLACEVKSSTKVKPVDLHDAAVQCFVLNGAGLDLADISIVHINTDYVRQGDLDLRQLFKTVSVISEVTSLMPEIPSNLESMRAALAAGVTPGIDIGPHCLDPYDCDFMGHCWAHVPEMSVFNVARLPEAKKFELYDLGILKIEDIPDDYPLSPTSRFHVDHHKSGEQVINREAIREFLHSLNYPLYFLDFETYNPAIPPFDGLKPYGHIPFLYSLHRKELPAGDLHHSDFLAEPGFDPRKPLVESLLGEVGADGDIVVYSQSFEATRLKELALQLPEFAFELGALGGRRKDLMQPFMDRDYYSPGMNGSYSIKAVLPALVPDLSYDDLAISDGNAAMSGYMELLRGSSQTQVNDIRQALRDYCRTDTLAMVRLVEALSTALMSPN